MRLIYKANVMALIEDSPKEDKGKVAFQTLWVGTAFTSRVFMWPDKVGNTKNITYRGS
jgi:hypothetical protein